MRGQKDVSVVIIKPGAINLSDFILPEKTGNIIKFTLLKSIKRHIQNASRKCSFAINGDLVFVEYLEVCFIPYCSLGHPAHHLLAFSSFGLCGFYQTFLWGIA